MISVAIYVRLSDEDRNKRFRTDESESIQQKGYSIKSTIDYFEKVYDRK